MAKKQLTPKSEDMSKWYTQVIQQAKLADYSPVKGCMVMRPGGYSIWEHIQQNLDIMLKELNVENAYFPLFIPMSFLEKEADHVEGFAPELAIVTHGGGEELEEKLVVRPTSETIMYAMYSKWVQSHRDLPILLNQWNNVVRWEKRTYFFLRTTEFLWQEAHTAHATHDEAMTMVHQGLEAYRRIFEEFLAIPVVTGKKSESEKFAGANLTTTIEAMMPDGKALQAGTSHDLGQNFSKKEAFDISFQDENGQMNYAWQTSYGLSTRAIGGLIMVHGDDDGLILPPKIAKVQVAIIPTQVEGDVLTASQKLAENLKASGIRAKVFDSPHYRMGWKLNESEIQGIPVTLVVGERELAEQKLSAKVRHSRQEVEVPLDNASNVVLTLLDDIHAQMLQKATTQRDSQTQDVANYNEFKEIMATKRGFLKAFWCEDAPCETAIKEETKATTRCLPFADSSGTIIEEEGQCVRCGQAAKHRWLFAQAY
jgi:prolyl-tRNA synthetase